VQRQPVLAETLGQHLHDPMRVVFAGKSDHEVVGVSDQKRAAPP
jgi:hypothetical protein